MDYDSIKFNYEQHLWNIQLVKMAVRKGVITSDQYKEITGFVYPNTK